jgi:DNA-binding GntR family transcriptional regulator
MVVITSEAMLLDQGPTPLHHLKNIIKSKIPLDEFAEDLCIKPKTPLLIIDRDYYGRNGSPMFATISYSRTDLYKYRIELTRT